MMILLTGGAACGKSFLAEQLTVHFPGKRYYLATMRPWGADGQAKVAKHRAMRQGKHFETIECYGDLMSVALETNRSVVLLECITNLVADELYSDQGELRPTDVVFNAVLDGVKALSSKCDNLVMITNDVGSDGIIYPVQTAEYVRLLGKVNCVIAAESDMVVDMSCGMPLLVKGGAALLGSMSGMSAVLQAGSAPK